MICTNSYKLIEEYCDINELKNEVLDDFTDTIDSGEAPAGDVLIADGEGGSDWGKGAS